MNTLYRRILQLLLAGIFATIACTAQVQTRGKVVDSTSRRPLPYVLITELSGHSSTVTTDQFGDFQVKTQPGKRKLLLSMLGYKSSTVIVEAGYDIVIEMTPHVVNMKDVVVLQRNAKTMFSTLTKIDLDLNPVRNTQELMRLVPGLFIAQHAGGGKAEQIFLRGFDVDHGTDVEVNVDGLPVNMVSHAHGQGYADAHFIIPETINNIDFGAGPYYTGHGNLNTAGYVSYSTFNTISKSRIQVEAGRYNTYRALAIVDLLRKAKDKQGAYIAADYNYTNGPTIFQQRLHRINLFGKYNLVLSDQTKILVTGSYFNSNWNASGQIPERAVNSGVIDRFGSIDPTEGGNTERQNINVLVTHKMKNGIVWENQAFFIRNHFNLFSNFSFFAKDTVNGDGIRQAENRALVGYKASLNQTFVVKTWSFTTTVGAGIRHDATKDSRLDKVVKRNFINHVALGDIRETNAYGYLQQQITRGNWLIDAGLRLDHLRFHYVNKLSTSQDPMQAQSILSPKLNIQYTVHSSLQFYLKTGKGFHSNDTRVVVANKGSEILPAAYGADIGVILKSNGKLLLNIAAWYLHLQQEFIYVGDEGIVEPGGRTRRQGFDLIARYQFSKHFFANVNLNITEARSIGALKGENFIPLAPNFTSTGGLFYKSVNGLNGGLTYRFIKDRPADETNAIVAKGYCLTDASFNYTTSKFEIGIAAENLFNVEWNEAQFATESRLRNEPMAITELNFTPGSPIFARLKLAFFF